MTSEIIPFAETYSLAAFSKEIPVVFNERKFDFRLMMPKYGFISERRYILREVIRLRDMHLNYMGTAVTASVKSAFIPNTKVQVYFLEHEEYYSPTDTNLYAQEVEGLAAHNAIRFGYFAAAALTTLNYLRWKPEVIICNDWQMSMLPLMIQSELLSREYFDGVKLIYILHSKSDQGNYPQSDFEAIGLQNLNKKLFKNKKMDVLAAALPLCDHILMIDSEDRQLTDKYQKDPVFKELFESQKSKISTYVQKDDSPEEWQSIADEIITIMGKI
jgi:starch synthase